MLDILTRSIARAGGVEVPDNVRIVEPSTPRRSIFESLAEAFERWNVRRSTWLTLNGAGRPHVDGYRPAPRHAA